MSVARAIAVGEFPSDPHAPDDLVRLVLGAVLLLFAAATATVLYWQLSRQLTRFAIQDIETIEGLLFFDSNGHLQLNEDYHNHAESRKILERLLEVLSPDGTLLYRNWRLGTDRLGGASIRGAKVSAATLLARSD